MSWGSDSNANRFKKSYIQGFLDVSGGNLIIESSSQIQVMSSQYSGYAALVIKPDRFSVFTGQSSYDISYVTFAALGALGSDYQYTTNDIYNRIQFIASNTLQGNTTIIGSDNSLCDLTVYGNIKTVGNKNLYITGDTSLNQKLYVAGNVIMDSNLAINYDLSVNRNLYVTNRSQFNNDVSMNQNVDIGSGNNSVSINKDISANVALDVSGVTTLRGPLYTLSDVSLTQKLFVQGDASFNQNLAIGQDVSINRSLFVTNRALFNNDVSMNRNLDIGTGNNSVAINKDISANIAFDVSGVTTLRGPLYAFSDVSLSQKLFVQGDASFNQNLSIGQDLSVNRFLYVNNRALFSSDVSINGNTRLNNSVSVNKDISSQYALDVSGVTNLRGTLYALSDVSFSQKLFVTLDASFNSSLSIGQDVSINRSLFVTNRAILNNDVSMNRNVDIGSGNNSVSINKDISANIALDVSGVTTLRGPLYTLSDVSINGKLSVGGDISLNGNISIGTTVQTIGKGLKQPPAPMTANVTNIPGHGAYYAYTSSYGDTTPYFMFDSNDTTSYNSAAGYTNPVGDPSINVWAFSDTISDVFANPYPGYRFHIDLPYQINLTSFSYRTSNGRYPAQGTMLGSNNGTSWYNIYSFDLSGTYNNSTNQTGPITFQNNLATNTSLYSKYALVIRSIACGSFPGSRFTLREIELYGNNNILSTQGIGATSIGVSDNLTVGATSNLYGNVTIGSIDNVYNRTGAARLLIMEPSGTVASATSGSLVLQHGDASGVSSIVFRSTNDVGSDYAYIQYQENVGGALQKGLLTIGVENDSGSGTTADRMSLYAAGGSGFIGLNTLDPQYHLDLSGNARVTGSITASLDVSLNRNIKLGSGTNSVSINKDISSQYALDISGITNTRGPFYAMSDVSLSQKLFVQGDASFNQNLAIGQDLSVNRFLYVTNNALFSRDVSINGNTKLNNSVSINKDISSQYALDVSGVISLRGPLYAFSDISLSQKLFVQGDASFNQNLAIGQDLSVNRFLYVTNNALFSRDVSINGNTRLNNSISVNKDISSQYALDISGITNTRGPFYAMSDVSLSQKLFIQGDASFNQNLAIGQDLSVNRFLYVTNNALFSRDVSINGNTRLNNSVSVNKDISSQYALDISGITNLRGPFYAMSDVSLNQNLAIGQDLSVNRFLYVTNNALFSRDVSINGNTRLNNSVSINKDISSQYALDISGITNLRAPLYAMLDVSLSQKLFVQGDASLNQNLAVGQDLSVNRFLYVTNNALFSRDVSINGNTRLNNSVSVNKDVSSQYALDVSGITNLRAPLYALSDVSLSQKLFVQGDTSFNQNLAIGQDLSVNRFLYVTNNALFSRDVSINGNTKLNNSVSINKDISSQYALDVSGVISLRGPLYAMSDVSLSQKLFVQGDASFNQNLAIGQDLSINRFLYVTNNALFSRDVSINGNTKLNNSVSINKDISSQYALDVSGITNLRAPLYAMSDLSLSQKLFVTQDASFNQNLSIGQDLSVNRFLYVTNNAFFSRDVSINGNTKHNNSVSINKDISSQYALDVSGVISLRGPLYAMSDLSLSQKLFVQGDASFNQNLSIGQDLSVNRFLYVTNNALFSRDVSINGNTKHNNSVSINKDISSQYALDVSGITSLRAPLYAMSDVSLSQKLFVTQDASFNQNLSIGQDLSINRFLYVTNNALFSRDVSINGNTKLNNSVSINKDISSQYALDVSGVISLRGPLYAMSDVSLSQKLFVTLDASFNQNLAIGRDLSVNRFLYVTNTALFSSDVSMNQNLDIGSGNNSVSINKDISSNIALDVSGITAFRGPFYALSDVSLSQKLFVQGDASFNQNLLIGQDLSVNRFLYVTNNALFSRDVSINGNTRLNNSVSINKDISSQYALDISGIISLRGPLYAMSDVSLSQKLFVTLDASFNQNLSVGQDVSVNRSLFVTNRSVFSSDVSMNRNVDIGSGNNSVSINKDISSNFALDISGETNMRGNLTTFGNIAITGGTITVNGLPVSGSGGGAGTSLTTQGVKVGTDANYFVTVDKTNFYNDPSLVIYYNFDTSVNGSKILNMAASGSTYDGSFNSTGTSTTTGMIDTTTRKYGTASLKNNPNSPNINVGVYVPNASSIPISTTMTFSMWVNKLGAPPAGQFDRIFEFSSGAQSSENNSIALDISSGGIIIPVLTSGSITSCLGTLTSPILSYNICDGSWNHIVWTITPSTSFIYINGSIKHYDSITAAVPTISRSNAYIAFTQYTSGTRDFSGNIDEFRYYSSKALNQAEIYQLYNNTFFNLDISGGFLANGSSVIYEPVGLKATANTGTLTLLHGDASGSSSIMFKSVNEPLEYGYIQYEENSAGSTGFHYGLMTIGIENDAGTQAAYTDQADRVSLFPSGGRGFVGVNTKTPYCSLDVSGQIRILEGQGTSASTTAGSLILEHTAVGGTSSIMFKGPNTSTSDYAYVQYTDASSVIQSLLKYDLSSGTAGNAVGNTTFASTGTNIASLSTAPTDNSFAWVTGTALNGFTPPVCISFNQTNVTLANTTSRINYLQTTLPSTMSSFTFSAWIQPAQIAASDSSQIAWMIANLTDASVNGSVDIYLDSTNGSIYATLGDDISNNIRTSSALSANNNWYHLVYTFDANLRDGFLYLNGQPSKTSTGTGHNNKALKRNANVLIGMKWGWNTGTGTNSVYGTTNKFKGFRGQMAFVNVFDRGISASDVLYLYNNPAYNITTNPERGLLTIGVENDTGAINNDRIVLWPGAGTGNVGINTRTPTTTLDINGTLNVSSTITSNNGTVIISGQSGAVLRLANQTGLYNSGETLLDFYGGESWRRLGGIGCNDRNDGYNGTYRTSTSFYTTYDTSYNLEAMRITGTSKTVANCATVQVFGDVNAVSYNATSDYRIKTSVMPLDLTFTVDVLNPVSYVLKDDKDEKLQVGFIAHEVQEFYPFLVNGVKDGPNTQSINYNGFIGILTKEIKDLKAKVLEQDARLTEQDARLQALEKLLLNK